MSDALYREQILEHWKAPHNFGELSDTTHSAFLNNPLCGDEIGMQLRVVNDRIEDIRFTGRGCAISIASASLLTDFVHEKNISEVQKITDKNIVTLLGTTPNPSRMKCALLGLETLRGSLADKEDS